MIAMAVKFPNSFLNSLVFILKGHSGEELVADFCDVQDLEQHIMNVRDYLDWGTQQEEFNFTENFGSSVIAGDPISTDDAKRFFSLCPEVCNLLDFVESGNAVQQLLEKYPDALCR